MKRLLLVLLLHCLSLPLAAEGWSLDNPSPRFGQVIVATYQGSEPLPGNLESLDAELGSAVRVVDRTWHPDEPEVLSLTLQVFQTGKVSITFPAESYLPPLPLEIASLMDDPPPESLPHGVRSALSEPQPPPRTMQFWLVLILASLFAAALTFWILSRKRGKPPEPVDPWQQWLQGLDDLERLALPDALWMSHLLGSLRDGLSLALDRQMSWATASEIRSTLSRDVANWEDLEPLLQEADRIQFGAGAITQGSQKELVALVRIFVVAQARSEREASP